MLEIIHTGEEGSRRRIQNKVGHESSLYDSFCFLFTLVYLFMHISDILHNESF